MDPLTLVTALSAASTSDTIHLLVKALRSQRDTPDGAVEHEQGASPQAAPDVAAEVSALRATLSPEDATAATIGTISQAETDLALLRGEQFRQARWAFNAALTLSVLGVLIILVAVLLLQGDRVTPGAVSAGVGAVCQVVSLLLFALSRSANRQLAEAGRDLHRLEKARVAMTIIDQMGDQSAKDQAIAKLAAALEA